jgi:hypothetical protein
MAKNVDQYQHPIRYHQRKTAIKWWKTLININVGAGLSKIPYAVQNNQIKTRPPHQLTAGHISMRIREK